MKGVNWGRMWEVGELGVTMIALLVLLVGVRLVRQFSVVFQRNQALSCSVPVAGLHWLLGGRTWAILRYLMRGEDGMVALGQEAIVNTQKYGPIYVGFVGFVPFVGLQGGEEVRAVCSASDGVSYRKNFGYELSRPLLGDSLLIVSGPTWKKHRKILELGFAVRTLQRAISIVDRLILDRIEEWRELACVDSNGVLCLTLDPFHEMISLTSDTIGMYTFSEPFHGSLAESFDVVLAMLGWKIWQDSVFPFWQYLPTPANIRYWRHLHRLKSRIAGLIEQRLRMSPQKREEFEDVLSLMIEEGVDESDKPSLKMEALQLRDECVGLVFAGHDTTASTMAWMLYLFGKHPQIQERVRCELDEVLGGREPTTTSLEKLKYLSAVIKEVLRLYPPASIGRTSIVPTDICGTSIPAGSEIFISILALQRNKKAWGDDAEEFRPQRFLVPLSEEQSLHYLPFGGAPRSCIGMRLALIELKIIVWRMLSSCQITLCANGPVPVMLPSLTLHPIRMAIQLNFRK